MKAKSLEPPSMEKIRAVIEEEGPATAKRLAEKTGFTNQTIYDQIEAGRLERDPENTHLVTLSQAEVLDQKVSRALRSLGGRLPWPDGFPFAIDSELLLWKIADLLALPRDNQELKASFYRVFPKYRRELDEKTPAFLEDRKRDHTSDFNKKMGLDVLPSR